MSSLVWTLITISCGRGLVTVVMGRGGTW